MREASCDAAVLLSLIHIWRLSVRVVNIYDKLQELGAVGKNPAWKSEKKQIFLPCPDRENRESVSYTHLDVYKRQ